MKTMPPSVDGHEYYLPTDEGREKRFKERLNQIKAWHRQHEE